jgi:hypothetical protein
VLRIPRAHMGLVLVGSLVTTACSSGGGDNTSASSSSGSGGTAPTSNSQVTIDGKVTKLDDGWRSSGGVVDKTELAVSAQSTAMPLTTVILEVHADATPAVGKSTCTDPTPSSVHCQSDMLCPENYPSCNTISGVCETRHTSLTVVEGDLGTGSYTSATDCAIDVTELGAVGGRVKGTASGKLSDGRMVVFAFDVPSE